MPVVRRRTRLGRPCVGGLWQLVPASARSPLPCSPGRTLQRLRMHSTWQEAKRQRTCGCVRDGTNVGGGVGVGVGIGNDVGGIRDPGTADGGVEGIEGIAAGAGAPGVVHVLCSPARLLGIYAHRPPLNPRRHPKPAEQNAGGGGSDTPEGGTGPGTPDGSPVGGMIAGGLEGIWHVREPMGPRHENPVQQSDETKHEVPIEPQQEAEPAQSLSAQSTKPSQSSSWLLPHWFNEVTPDS